MTELSREAVHESAHATVATLLGIEVGEVTLSPARCYAREPNLNRHRDVVAHIRIALAGAIVDERFEFYAAEASSDKLRAAELIDGLYAETPDELDRSDLYWDRVALSTERQVAAYWPLILTLAEELTRTKVVSGRRVRELVRSAKPSVTAAPRPRPIDWQRKFREIASTYTGERV